MYAEFPGFVFSNISFCFYPYMHPVYNKKAQLKSCAFYYLKIQILQSEHSCKKVREDSQNDNCCNDNYRNNVVSKRYFF